MFANRYTAFIDACTLARVLPRNLLLSLAEAGFFRLRWSAAVLKETEAAIAKMLQKKGRTADEAAMLAGKHIASMKIAFEEAEVSEFEHLTGICDNLPDPDDAHVVAAALKARASTIVTENLKDFPPEVMASLSIEIRSVDDFLADTIALDAGKAVAAIRKMRERFNKPEKTAEALLLDMEAAGLIATADQLKPHLDSL